MSALESPTPPRWAPPQRARLPGGRLHLQQGPIDLVIGADGPPAAIDAAHARAADRFAGLLDGLVAELELLRTPLPVNGPDRPAGPHAAVADPVGRAMVAACWPHRALWLTPMAAVAGAVADAVLAATAAEGDLRRVWVNNGGDIALWLAPGETLRLGVVSDLALGLPDGLAKIAWSDRPRGVATSGRGGRSLSRGIADSVTVLAATAAAADAAATLIANAVDLDHPAVVRAPAASCDPDSDLGELPVTLSVGPLPPNLVDRALAGGAALAGAMRTAGRIDAALLSLQGKRSIVSVQQELVGWS